MKLLGSVIYVTSYFLWIWLIGSLLSTLDSLLFCSFIIHRKFPFFKLGCSIEITAKCWNNCEWTQVFFCDMMVMLGGFRAWKPPIFVCMFRSCSASHKEQTSDSGRTPPEKPPVPSGYDAASAACPAMSDPAPCASDSHGGSVRP